MSREYVYFLSHAPTGSLCSLPSFSLSQRRFQYKEKSNQKKRSCPPSQHRTQRSLSTYPAHSTLGVDGHLGHSTTSRLRLTIMQLDVRSVEEVLFSTLACCKLWSSKCWKLESSHGRGAAKFSELLTCGAQYFIRNMVSKKVVRATPPTFPCASPETIVQVILSN